MKMKNKSWKIVVPALLLAGLLSFGTADAQMNAQIDSTTGTGMTGSRTTGTSTTPGLPNTGSGGNTFALWSLLISGAVLAAGTSVYAGRKAVR